MNVNEPVAWEGAEEWEPLAWELCADEHGEESCTDLIWDMGVIPEPWGDRWQKYEDEAKRMISMVRKCTHPVKELTDEEANDCHKEAWKLADDATGNCRSYTHMFQLIFNREFARAVLRKAQEK